MHPSLQRYNTLVAAGKFRLSILFRTQVGDPTMPFFNNSPLSSLLFHGFTTISKWRQSQSQFYSAVHGIVLGDSWHVDSSESRGSILEAYRSD
jgi:hypothetical protein